MKTALLIFLVIVPAELVYSQGSTPLINLNSSAINVFLRKASPSFPFLLNNHLKNSYYQNIISDPSFELFPAAIKFAWQIRATNQFGNPVTDNNGKSEVFCLAFYNINHCINRQGRQMQNEFGYCNRRNCINTISNLADGNIGQI